MHEEEKNKRNYKLIKLRFIFQHFEKFLVFFLNKHIL